MMNPEQFFFNSAQICLLTLSSQHQVGSFQLLNLGVYHSVLS